LIQIVVRYEGNLKVLRKDGAMRLRIALLAGLAFLGVTPAAHAQACALCYTTASATSAAAQRSLDFGILTLLTPALFMFLAVLLLLYRRAISAAA
jgi:hypothetical protein